MDPETISLAVKVMDVLIPYATIGAGQFVKTAGKDAYEKAKGLFETLKMRWSEDEEASEALEKFEKKPVRYQPIIEDVLKEKLEKQTGLADELQKILNNMGPEIEIIQKMAVAPKTIAASSSGGRTARDSRSFLAAASLLSGFAERKAPR